MTDVVCLKENKWIFYICSCSQSNSHLSDTQQFTAAQCTQQDWEEEDVEFFHVRLFVSTHEQLAAIFFVHFLGIIKISCYR